MYKKFNWETAWGSQQRILWLAANSGKKVSLEEYIAANKALKQYHVKNKNWKTNGRKNYQTKRVTKQYNYLKKTFGFFE